MNDQRTLNYQELNPGEDSPQGLSTLIELMAFLKKVPLFSKLCIEELGLIAKIAREEYYPDEAVLIEEGVKNQKLYIIAQGFVELSARLLEGQQGTIGILRAANCLGEDGIFSDSPSPICAQIVMGEARIITIEGEELKHLVRLYPEIAIGLLAATSSHLHRVQRMMIKLEQ